MVEKLRSFGIWAGIVISVLFTASAIQLRDHDVFGHYSVLRHFERPVYLDTGKRIWPAEGESLESGHRCLRRQVLEPEASGSMCLDKSGRESSVAVYAARDWRVSCCVELVPDSDRELSAYSRRFFAALDFPSSVFPGALILVLLILAIVALSAGLMWIVALLVSTLLFPLIALVLGLWNLGTALTRLSLVVARTVRQLDVQPWKPCPVGHKPVALVHFSDLHISRGVPYELRVNPMEYGGESISDVSGSNLCIRLERLLCAALEHNPAAFVFTGDLTDTGSDEEWDLLRATMAKAFEHAQCPRVFAVPGNHDVSLNVGEQPDLGGLARGRREELTRRNLAALSANTNREGKVPYSFELELADARIHVLALNSCRYPSRFILSNAIGAIGKRQLEWVRATLAGKTGPLVVLLHHHIALPPGRIGIRHPIESAVELLKLPVDVGDLVKCLLSYSCKMGNHVLVLHGHQHEELRYELKDKRGGCVSFSGLGSSTLGGLVSSDFGRRLQLDGVPRYARVAFHDKKWCIDFGRS